MLLSEIFYLLLSMSISGGLCAAVISLIQKIPHIPKKYVRHLWIIPFLRLVLPFGLPLKYGLLEVTAKLTRTVAVPVKIGDTDIRALAYNHIALAERYVPFTYKTDMIRKIFDIASVVWAVVAVLLIAFFVLSYVISVNEQNRAVHYKDNIYFSETASTPFLLGVIRPKIIIPRFLYAEDNTFIITHEKSHMRALDNFSRLVAVSVCILHWYNPFVWVFLRIYLRNLELACDERVTAGFDIEQRKAYAESLIEHTRPNFIFVSGVGSSDLSKRIKSIISYKKISAFSVIFITVLFTASAYILLSNGQPPTG